MSSSNSPADYNRTEILSRVTLMALDAFDVCPRPLHMDADLDHLRRIIMEAALAKCNGNVCAAARLLGINRDAMRYRLGLTRKKQRPTTAS